LASSPGRDPAGLHNISLDPCRSILRSMHLGMFPSLSCNIPSDHLPPLWVFKWRFCDFLDMNSNIAAKLSHREVDCGCHALWSIISKAILLTPDSHRQYGSCKSNFVFASNGLTSCVFVVLSGMTVWGSLSLVPPPSCGMNSEFRQGLFIFSVKSKILRGSGFPSGVS
jgi:hypothetical protein